MTPLRHAATDYLGLRRALGFKLRANEDALIEFTDFLDRRGVSFCLVVRLPKRLYFQQGDNRSISPASKTKAPSTLRPNDLMT